MAAGEIEVRIGTIGGIALGSVEGLVIAESGQGTDLRRNCLSFPETIAQSFANIAPTVTPAMAIPLVAATAGYGTWVSYLISMAGLVLVGWNISIFARRHATSGSIYTYVLRGIGKNASFAAGWSLLAAYTFTGMAVLVGFGIFANLFLSNLGIQVPTWILYVAGAAVVWYLAFKDIRLSSTLALSMELVSVGFITLLAVIAWGHTGFRIDAAQWTLRGATLPGISQGMVLAVFSFVGFESAATLGKESRNPHRVIPRAVLASSTAAGFFFIALAYIEMASFPGGLHALQGSATPLNTLAAASGMPWFGILIDFGAMISFFSCTLASVNAASRILYTMGRDRIFHDAVGRAHSVNQTPHLAVTITSVLTLLFSLLLLGVQPMSAYGYFGTFATYGFLTVYILVSLAAPLYLRRLAKFRARHGVVGGLAFLFMLIPLAGSVYPVPAFPYNLLPYAFLLYVAAGLAWYRKSAGQDAGVVERMQSDFDAEEEMVSGRK